MTFLNMRDIVILDAFDSARINILIQVHMGYCFSFRSDELSY